jgi:glutathione peroxidase
MVALTAVALLIVVAGPTPSGAEEAEESVPAALDFEVQALDGQDVALQSYLGDVVMIVNVASECGLTLQYEQLQALHEEYAEQGLAILAFPCNQFGEQEPGTASEIREFCSTNYGVTFDLFAKVDVNDEGACDLYQHLTSLETKPKGRGKIGWNFEKFVIDRQGQVVGRFEPRTKPDAPEVIKLLEGALAEN